MLCFEVFENVWRARQKRKITHNDYKQKEMCYGWQYEETLVRKTFLKL